MTVFRKKRSSLRREECKNPVLFRKFEPESKCEISFVAYRKSIEEGIGNKNSLGR